MAKSVDGEGKLVAEMDASELAAELDAFKRQRRVSGLPPKDRYQACANELWFLLDVDSVDSDTHREFFRDNLEEFEKIHSKIGYLAREQGVERDEGLEKELSEFQNIQREAEKRARQERELKKLEELEAVVEAAAREEMAKKERRVAAAETGSRSLGADHQPQGHTVVTVPPTPPSSAHEGGRDHTLANTPSTSTSSAGVGGKEHKAVPVSSAASSVQSVSESGIYREDDEVSSSARSSSDASSLSKAQVHPSAAAGGGTPERRVLSSSSSSEASSSHDSEEFNEVERMAGENHSSQLEAGALEAVPRGPGQHHEEWHSTVQRQDLDEMHKSLDGSSVNEEEHRAEYSRRDHEFSASQESSMDFDQGEPIRVFSITGEGRNYVEGAMRDFLSSQYQRPEEAFRNMSVSELKGHLNDKHSDVVEALSAQIERDYREKKLKPIEGRAAPSIPVQGQAEPDEVTTYTFKGKTLTQTEHQVDGKISFDAQQGLNAVVRIQRRDRSGELIEAFDTVEYKNGQVAALVMGKGGESRLANIGLMRSQIKKRGGVEFGGVEDEQELPLAPSRLAKEEPVREGLPVEKEKRIMPSSAAAGEGPESEDEKMAKARAEADSVVSVHRRKMPHFSVEDEDVEVFRKGAPSTPSVAKSSGERKR